jgi:hypothetical protein
MFCLLIVFPKRFCGLLIGIPFANTSQVGRRRFVSKPGNLGNESFHCTNYVAQYSDADLGNHALNADSVI